MKIITLLGAFCSSQFHYRACLLAAEPEEDDGNRSYFFGEFMFRIGEDFNLDY